MSSQFREHGMRILAYMKEHGIELGVEGDPTSASLACMRELDLTPFEMSRGMRYLLSQKLVIPSGESILSRRYTRIWAMAGMGMAPGMVLVVNPHPPAAGRPAERRAKKRAKKAAPSLKRVPQARGDVPTSTRKTPARPRKAAPTVSGPNAVTPEQPHTDIDPVIQHFLTKAIQALRAAATGSDEVLLLGVVNCADIVHNGVPGLTKSQARRLTEILHKMKLVSTCDVRPGGGGGCSHVHASPGLITAAMVRRFGYHVEDTVDDLRVALEDARQHTSHLDELLREKEAELAELREAKALVLAGDLAERVQYLVLKALAAPPAREESEER